MIAKGNNSVISLSHKIPVHLTYFTMTADEKGKTQSFPDVYGLDAKMASALFGKAAKIDEIEADASPVVGPQPRRLERPRRPDRQDQRAVRQLGFAFALFGRGGRRRALDRGKDGAGKLGERRIARSHEENEIARPRLLGDARDEPLPRRRELGVSALGGDLGDDVGRGKVARRRTARVKYFEHPETVVWLKLAGENPDEVVAQEARRTVAMRLIDGEHAL